MNPSNTWKGKLEAASFFCHLETYTGSVYSLQGSIEVWGKHFEFLVKFNQVKI